MARLFICDYGNYRIQKRTADYGFIGKYDDGIAYNDCASDGTYLYFTRIRSVAGSYQLFKIDMSEFKTVVAQGGLYGTGDGQLNWPYGVWTDGTHVWVCDNTNHRIQKFLCADLSFVAKQGSHGSGDDNWSNPTGICGDDSGNYLYVTDTTNHRIKKILKTDMSYVAKIGSLGSGNDQFRFPCYIDTDGTNLFICDNGSNQRIKKHLCADLSYVAKLGSSGTGENEFTSIQGMACDGTNIYVGDSTLNRIQTKLCSDLSLVLSWGSTGSGNDQVNAPYGIEYDSGDDDDLYPGEGGIKFRAKVDE